MGSYVYVLMYDKIGWRTLARKNVGLDLDYMRSQQDCPEVDVPKGTLVVVDPDCLVMDRDHGSANVISLDHHDGQNEFGKVKITVIMKVRFDFKKVKFFSRFFCLFINKYLLRNVIRQL